MANINRFWYESNACWGWVESIDDLKEKAELQMSDGGCFDTINEFLDNSKQHYDSSNSFGTRNEHRDGKKTLREHLSESSFDFSLLTHE